MANPQGPKLRLGDTDAGQIIKETYGQVFEKEGRDTELIEMNRVLQQKFDDKVVMESMNGLLADLDKLRRKQLLQRIGRWTIRLTMVGGAVVATLLTENPAAFRAAVAVAGPLETILRRQKQMSKAEIAALKAEISSTAVQRRTGAADYSGNQDTGGDRVTEVVEMTD
jgi:hypothetical protein